MDTVSPRIEAEVLLGSCVTQGPRRECSRQSRAIVQVLSSPLSDFGIDKKSTRRRTGTQAAGCPDGSFAPQAYRRRRTEDGASLVCVCRKSRPCLQSLHSPVDERRADAVSCVETANATTQRETGSCRGSPWGGCRESSHPCWSSPRPLLPRGPDSIADSGWAVGRLDRASTEQHPSQVLEARKSTERWCLGADETGGTGPFNRLPPRISTLRPRVQDSRERTAAIVPIHGIGQRSDQISHPAVDIVRVLLGCCSGPGQSLMPR